MQRGPLIWQIGVVRRGPDGRAWLEFGDPGACTRCSHGTGCGAALFSRLFARPDIRIPLTDDVDRRSGQLVRAGLDPRWLVLAAAAAYLVPVLTFVLGAVAADVAWPGNDLAALFTGLMVSLATVATIRRTLRMLSRPPMTLVDLSEPLE